MATELESLILSISADTAQVRRALKRMESDSKETATNIENAFDNVVPFDRMQQGFSRSAKAMAGDAQNLRFQFNDLFTQISGGTSVAQAFAQQAGQISQVLGSAGGMRGTIGLVGQALAGMLNPLYAIPIAISLALPAITSFFSESEEGGEDAAKSLETQRDLIRQVASEWGDALPALKAYNDELSKQEQIAKAISGVNAAVAQSQEQSMASIGKVDGALTKILELFDRFPQKAAAIAELQSAWAELQKRIEDGSATTEEIEALQAKFNETLARLPLKAARDLAGVMRSEVVPALRDSVSEMQRLRAEQDALAAKQETMRLQGRMNLPAMSPELSTVPAELSGAAADAAQNMKSLAEALEETGRAAQQQLTPLTSEMINTQEFSRGVEEYKRLAGEAKGITAQFIKDQESFRANAYWDVNAWRTGFGSDTYVDAMGNVQKVTQQTVVSLEQANADLARRIGEFQQTIVRQIGPEFWASLSEQQQAALTSIAYNYGSLPDSIVRAIKAGDRGQVAQAIAALGSDNGGINRRRRNEEASIYGGGAFNARAASTDAAASSTDRLTDSTNRLSAADQRLAGVGGSVIAGMDQQAMAAQQLAQAYAQIGQSAVSGLVSDLREGVSVGEAFSNMLNRVIDGLVNMAIQAMFSQQALGGLFGGGGGLFGGGGMGVGLYHQGGKVGSTAVPRRTVSPAMFAGAPRLHNGLRAGEFPAILQRGETVIPRSSAMTRGAPLSQVSTSLGDVNIDMSQTGMVAANSDSAKQFGINVQKLIQAEMVRESRPGGLLRRA